MHLEYSLTFPLIILKFLKFLKKIVELEYKKHNQ